VKAGTATVGLAVTAGLALFASWITFWLIDGRDMTDLFRFTVGMCVGLVCGIIAGTIWTALAGNDES
jgi:hypothetical protein